VGTEAEMYSTSSEEDYLSDAELAGVGFHHEDWLRTSLMEGGRRLKCTVIGLPGWVLWKRCWSLVLQTLAYAADEKNGDLVGRLREMAELFDACDALLRAQIQS
jgi:hypothetical protein